MRIKHALSVDQAYLITREPDLVLPHAYEFDRALLVKARLTEFRVGKVCLILFFACQTLATIELVLDDAPLSDKPEIR